MTAFKICWNNGKEKKRFIKNIEANQINNFEKVEAHLNDIDNIEIDKKNSY